MSLFGKILLQGRVKLSPTTKGPINRDGRSSVNHWRGRSILQLLQVLRGYKMEKAARWITAFQPGLQRSGPHDASYPKDSKELWTTRGIALCLQPPAKKNLEKMSFSLPMLALRLDSCTWRQNQDVLKGQRSQSHRSGSAVGALDDTQDFNFNKSLVISLA